ncbi:unnamed protein product [Pelagomonas calceolata]|uniref:Uncharacterized protein n=1 Tax=Pelagomonas calceolata TaxID=35677 RepID=A0A8J2SZI3_9STRA|nr:unnamed protein product [Pelagomonas calceolata]
MQRPLNPRTCKICCTNACHTDAAIRLQICERCRAMIRLSSHTHACAPMRSYLYNIIICRITWLPKACRNAAVRQQVAEAVIKAICGVTASETTPDKVVSTDAFPLPKGYSLNPDLQAHPHASSEIGIGSEDPMKGPQK